MNHWRDVVNQQVKVIQSSGLTRHAKIMVNIAGPEEVKLPPDFIICQRSHLHEFEFPTLSLLWDHCRKNHGRVFYIHTKGVGHDSNYNNDPWLQDIKPEVLRHHEDQWRNYLMHFNVRQWHRCLRGLDNHDLCGVSWQTNIGPSPYFEGNFWWGRNEYLSALPEPRMKNDRGEAELWVGSNSPKILNRWATTHDFYRLGIPPNSYVRQIMI